MSNPNPMNSRCGLEDCDCGYTIEKLVGVLDRVAENCTAGLHPSQSPRDKDTVFRYISRAARRAARDQAKEDK